MYYFEHKRLKGHETMLYAPCGIGLKSYIWEMCFTCGRVYVHDYFFGVRQILGTGPDEVKPGPVDVGEEIRQKVIEAIKRKEQER